jgi:hypothetical protein
MLHVKFLIRRWIARSTIDTLSMLGMLRPDLQYPKLPNILVLIARTI